MINYTNPQKTFIGPPVKPASSNIYSMGTPKAVLYDDAALRYVRNGPVSFVESISNALSFGTTSKAKPVTKVTDYNTGTPSPGGTSSWYDGLSNLSKATSNVLTVFDDVRAMVSTPEAELQNAGYFTEEQPSGVNPLLIGGGIALVALILIVMKK